MKKWLIVLVAVLNCLIIAFLVLGIYHHQNELLNTIFSALSIASTGGCALTLSFTVNNNSTRINANAKTIAGITAKMSNSENGVLGANSGVIYQIDSKGGEVNIFGSTLPTDFSAMPSGKDQDNITAVEALDMVSTQFKTFIENWEAANIEKISNRVKEKLVSEQLNDLPSPAFIKKYLEEAKNIADEDIQNVWAELFVYETKNKGSIKLRTLEVLKNMTIDEADLFKEISKFIARLPGYAYFFNDCFKNVVKLIDITKLADIGIFKQAYTLSWNPTIKKDEYILFVGENRVLKILSKTGKALMMPAYVLTDVGYQLLVSMDYKTSDDALRMIKENINISHPADFKASLHNIQSKGGNTIVFSNNEIE